MSYRAIRPGVATLLTSPWLWLLVSLAATGLVASISPLEKSLGANVRIVYLHGAWVWTALAGFVAAGLAGILGLLTRKKSWLYWSAAWGYTGLIFWITYLPISIWAMQMNWNGLFLAEPRWRLAAIFAITGLLLQAGLFLLHSPVAYGWGNLVFVTSLLVMLRGVNDVMHPASPVFSSDSSTIQVYFTILLVLTLAAAWQAARLLKRYNFGLNAGLE